MLSIVLILFTMLPLALLTIHTARLEVAIIALAGLSVLTASLLYLLGAVTAGVIELSVGAGLVAVLFAFANSILVHQPVPPRSPIPRWMAFLLAAPVICTGVIMLTVEPLAGAVEEASFQVVFWEQRSSDVLAQLALIFTTVVGVLTLLQDTQEEKLDVSVQEAVESTEIERELV